MEGQGTAEERGGCAVEGQGIQRGAVTWPWRRGGRSRSDSLGGARPRTGRPSRSCRTASGRPGTRRSTRPTWKGCQGACAGHKRAVNTAVRNGRWGVGARRSATKCRERAEREQRESREISALRENVGGCAALQEDGVVRPRSEPLDCRLGAGVVLRGRKEMECLSSHEGRRKTGEIWCRSHEGSGNTWRRQYRSDDGRRTTRQRQCLRHEVN